MLQTRPTKEDDDKKWNLFSDQWTCQPICWMACCGYSFYFISVLARAFPDPDEAAAAGDGQRICTERWGIMKTNIRNESVSCKWCRAQIVVSNCPNAAPLLLVQDSIVNIHKACVQECNGLDSIPSESKFPSCPVLRLLQSLLDHTPTQSKFRAKVWVELLVIWCRGHH